MEENREYSERDFRESKQELLHRDSKKKGKGVQEKKFSVAVIPYENFNSAAMDTAKHLVRRLEQAEAKSGDGQRKLISAKDSYDKPRPFTLRELEVVKKGNFNEDDILYVCGHANQAIIGSMNPGDLAQALKGFLDKTGIKSIKLAGCHTGSKILESDIPMITPNRDVIVKAVTDSYACKLSQELGRLGFDDVKVYGYIGMHQENDDNVNQTRKAKTSGKMHSYVIPLNSDGSENNSGRMRANESRVCFMNGEKIEGPKQEFETHQEVQSGGQTNYFRARH